MIILKSILQGFFISVGFTSFLICVSMLIKVVKKRKKSEGKRKGLLKAFKSYLDEVTQDEKFEEIEDVEFIIESLEDYDTDVTDMTKMYSITENKKVIMSEEEDGSQSFHVKVCYKVEGRKTI